MDTKRIKGEVTIHEHITYSGGKRLQRNEIILNDEQYSYLLAQAERAEEYDKRMSD
ncbi:hypothetical protein [Terribacillus saccharophilus]|uniref:hypothetical protein n=1 Tax=Terribacillus saccharophilus TaxID=361277 RepID=UPI0015954557|nr:hypothetical protein [Terribacillus saccharophilus]